MSRMVFIDVIDFTTNYWQTIQSITVLTQLGASVILVRIVALLGDSLQYNHT